MANDRSKWFAFLNECKKANLLVGECTTNEDRTAREVTRLLVVKDDIEDVKPPAIVFLSDNEVGALNPLQLAEVTLHRYATSLLEASQV